MASQFLTEICGKEVQEVRGSKNASLSRTKAHKTPNNIKRREIHEAGWQFLQAMCVKEVRGSKIIDTRERRESF
jgi:hypothetical protein